METLAIQPDIIEQDRLERLKAEDDVTTQFSELVDGSMRTSFELEFDGGDLNGRDGRGLQAIAKKSLAEARQTANINPRLRFEVRRRSLEEDEIGLAIRMAKGELPNTMVIASDFPEELMEASEDIGGYNITRKQTMLRVLALRPDGKVQMYSQSLDGSDRSSLEAIYDYFGVKPENGELLGQRIHVDLSPQDQAVLVDGLTGVYDRTMTARYGGEWYAGRRPADYRNTYSFVCSQDDLVQECVQLKLAGQLTDGLMYDMAATMQKRFRATKAGVPTIMPRISNPASGPLHQEMMLAGYEARLLGEDFSACGVTLKADGLDVSTETQMEEAGYGNKAKPEDCEFVSKECPKCHEKNVKTVVKDGVYYGACGCKSK